MIKKTVSNKSHSKDLEVSTAILLDKFKSLVPEKNRFDYREESIWTTLFETSDYSEFDAKINLNEFSIQLSLTKIFALIEIF